MGEGPTRTCAGCRKKRPQGRLIRVARSASGEVTVEDASVRCRAPGRGAYVCFDEACVRRALRAGSLRRALRAPGDLPEAVVQRLAHVAQEGPAEEDPRKERRSDGEAQGA